MAKDKGRLAPFVPLLKSTLDAPAWKALSMGARSLYLALKRRVPKDRNRAYLSTRNAADELAVGKTQARRWFAELEHYKFIVLLQAGCLGTDGKGKAPHWRLTELGQTSKTSAEGLFEPPTNDFLKWDGTRFHRTDRGGPPGGPGTPPQKNRIPGPHQTQGGPPSDPGLGPHQTHLNPKVGPHQTHRELPKWAPIRPITSKPLPACSGASAGAARDAAGAPAEKPWSKPTIIDEGPRRFRRRPNGRWSKSHAKRPRPPHPGK